MRAFTQLLLTFLLNASWQVALVLMVAALGDWLLRGTAARYRHALWISALGLAFALPLLSSISLLEKTSKAKPQPVATRTEPAFVTRVYSPDLDFSEPANPANSAVVSSVEAPRRSFLVSGIPLSRRVATILLVVYGFLLLLRVSQLARAWRRTQKIVQSAYECEFGEQARSIISQCRAVIGVSRVRILCSAAVPVPVTVGVLKPLIILPSNLAHDVDQEVLTTAIGHELVHVARRDYFANLVCEVVYLPLSFHPAAAFLRRRIKQTRELCCDESVAARLIRPEAYARSLVRLIGAAPMARRLAVDTTIGISESDILEVRIMSLLKRSKLTNRRKRLVLIATALLLAAPCVAATSFALTFNIDRQEPKASAPTEQKMDRAVAERKREELKQAVLDLQEKVRVAPASQRQEAEARLVEVQRNLEIHERMLRDYEAQRRSNETSAGELRETLAQLEKARPMDELRLKETREKLAVLDRLSSEKRLRDEQELAPLQGVSANRRARVIYRAEPEYPQDARERKIEGTVVLTLTVDHQGLPQNISVKRSLYPSLDQSAIEAARKMRFEPAMKDGQPVSMFISVEMDFKVEPGQYDPQRAAADKLNRETAERDATIGYANRSVDLEMRRKRELEGQSREERSRKQAELTRDATLSMDRAIQIATSQVPGKVLACSLGRDGEKVFYHVVIISGDGDKSTTTYVWVSATDGQIIKTEKEERREREETSLELRPMSINGGVLNGKATSMPSPLFPAIARQAHASGQVMVEVSVDEAGNVIAAHAVSGHPLLQAAAVSAARQAKFTPTRLNGEPTRVAGVLVYTFATE